MPIGPWVWPVASAGLGALSSIFGGRDTRPTWDISTRIYVGDQLTSGSQNFYDKLNTWVGKMPEGSMLRRNWDNARGHHQMLDVVRLNEAVLAQGRGHWLAPPAEVRWTEEQAAARDRLLRARIDRLPALLKDPRTLLTLPFWRASRVPYQGQAREGILPHSNPHHVVRG